MKFIDYFYYKFAKFYEGEPHPDFYPIYALTGISISTTCIFVNTTELFLSKKIIELNEDSFIFLMVLSLTGFFSLLYYLVYVKFGRNTRIFFPESPNARIVGWTGIIILIVVLAVSAFWINQIRSVRLI